MPKPYLLRLWYRSDRVVLSLYCTYQRGRYVFRYDLKRLRFQLSTITSASINYIIEIFLDNFLLCIFHFDFCEQATIFAYNHNDGKDISSYYDPYACTVKVKFTIDEEGKVLL